MSKYKEIMTEFKNPASLMKALDDMNAVYEVGQNPKENAVVLFTNWKTYGGINQQVAIAVQKQNANRAGLGDFDGIGFQWNGKGFTLIKIIWIRKKMRLYKKMSEDCLSDMPTMK